MARASYIYLVCPHSRLGMTGVYAAFTVKREAHEWAYWSDFPMDQLQLDRMKDSPGGKRPAIRQSIPWDQKTVEWLNGKKRQMLERNPEGPLADHVV